MCKFCEPTKEEITSYYAWATTNPYNGDRQVNYEGIDYLLHEDKFLIDAMFDGGYLHDSFTLKFNYCPKCGRKL